MPFDRANPTVKSWDPSFRWTESMSTVTSQFSRSTDRTEATIPSSTTHTDKNLHVFLCAHQLNFDTKAKKNRRHYPNLNKQERVLKEIIASRSLTAPSFYGTVFTLVNVELVLCSTPDIALDSDKHLENRPLCTHTVGDNYCIPVTIQMHQTIQILKDRIEAEGDMVGVSEEEVAHTLSSLCKKAY
ncbi:hypothetical protein NMY22_g8167 [Coprinellus aureogranulatus]|nr:hypothetical protein NMY22_g8167 [Coprinellus aureogranulatus]